MATAGVYAQYNPQLRLSNQKSFTQIAPILGVNPVDIGTVELKNIRGYVYISLSATDDPTGTYASFAVKGGYGRYPEDYTWNWYVDAFSLEWCVVTQLSINTFSLTTLAPLVPRTYTISFNPGISYPPVITRTGGPLLGTETLVITQNKQTSYVTNFGIVITP